MSGLVWEALLAWLQTYLLPALGVGLGHSVDVQISHQEHANKNWDLVSSCQLGTSGTFQGSPARVVFG